MVPDDFSAVKGVKHQELFHKLLSLDVEYGTKISTGINCHTVLNSEKQEAFSPCKYMFPDCTVFISLVTSLYYILSSTVLNHDQHLNHDCSSIWLKKKKSPKSYLCQGSVP